MKAIEMLIKERERQLNEEGWTTEHDDTHIGYELSLAAGSYIAPVFIDDNRIPVQWPWDKEWWKPSPDNKIKELVKAGALIIAEIERLQRQGE